MEVETQPTQAAPAPAADAATKSAPSADTTTQDAQPGADTSNAEDTNTQEPSEIEKLQHATQKEITKLRNSNREKDRQLQETAAELAKYKQAESKLVRPNIDDFDDAEEYGKAVGRYEAKLEVLQQQQKEAQERQQRQQQESAEKIKSTFEANEKKFSAGLADYETASDMFQMVFAEADPRSFTTQVIADYIMQNEDGPAVGYHFGKNPEELRKVMGLGHVAAMRELGRLSARLEANPTPKPKPKPLDRPPNPLGGTGSTATSKTLSADNMTDAEYKKARWGK